MISLVMIITLFVYLLVPTFISKRGNRFKTLVEVLTLWLAMATGHTFFSSFMYFIGLGEPTERWGGRFLLACVFLILFLVVNVLRKSIVNRST